MRARITGKLAEGRTVDYDTLKKAAISIAGIAHVDRSGGMMRTDNFQGILNSNNELISITSRAYKPINHFEIDDMVMNEVGSKYGNVTRTFKIDMMDNKFVGRYKFNDISYDIGRGDTIIPELTVRNAHDLRWCFESQIGAFRLVCSNGLVIGDIIDYARIKHVGVIKTNIKDVIYTSMTRFSETIDKWMSWNREVPYSLVLQIMKDMKLSTRKSEELAGYLVSTLGTSATTPAELQNVNLWQAFNVFTWYATHKLLSEQYKAGFERSLAKSVRKNIDRSY